jgi:hypothetical protein
MAKQTINIGSTANDGTGSTLRVGGDLINDNFNEIYTAFGDGSTLSNAIPGKVQGANFTGSLLVGHSTTGALSTASNNTGIGIAALDALTSGDANTAMGGNAGSAISSGVNNTAVGNATLFSLSTGSNNTAIGKSSLQVTTGSYNIGIGYTSGINISSGDGNVIIGDVDADSATGDRQLKIAGFDGSTRTTWISGDSSGNLVTPGTITANGILLGAGLAHKLGGTDFTNSLLIGHSTHGTLNNAQSNTGVGIAALDNLSAGDFNTAVGFEAVSSVSSTRYNTGIGYRALRTTTGESNTAVGGIAMYGTYGGNFNTAIGKNALTTNNTGDNNTALGNDSGKLITSDTANYNLTLGSEAGDNITSGAGNVIIGSVDAGSATGDRQLKIAGYDGSTTTTWITGDSAGLLNITGGEVIPGKIEGTNFTDSLLIGHATTGTLNAAERNTGVGIDAMQSLTSGDRNTSIGYQAGKSLASGSYNTAIGDSSGKVISSGQHNTNIGMSAGNSNTGASHNTNIGSGAGSGLNGSASGNVMIGSSTNGDDVSGDRQLKISGYDGTTRTTWISGDSSGNVTMTLAANQITSTQLTGAVSLQILSSDGTVVKTLFGAGS